MNKKSLAMLLTLILLVSTSLNTAHAAPAQIDIQPDAMLSTSASLTKSGSDLCMYVRFLYTSSEMTYYNISLQQLSGGVWTPWTSYTDIRNEQLIIFEKYVSPPKGYMYRLKITGSSLNFPNFEFYSNELYY